MLQYENQHARWLAGYVEMARTNTTNLPNRQAGQPLQAWEQSLYTNAGGENGILGGWSAAGMARYSAILKDLKAAKKAMPAKWKGTEEILLACMRKMAGLAEEDGTAEQKKRNDKKRKRDAKKKEAAQKKVAVEEIVLDFSDDEEIVSD